MDEEVRDFLDEINRPLLHISDDGCSPMEELFDYENVVQSMLEHDMVVCRHYGFTKAQIWPMYTYIDNLGGSAAATIHRQYRIMMT